MFSLKLKEAFIKEIISFLWEAQSKAVKTSENLSINLVGLYIRLSVRNSKCRSIKKLKIKWRGAGGGKVS